MNTNRKKIVVGYVNESNPFTNRTAWSGLVYKIRESIENAGFEVVWIKSRPNGKIDKLFKTFNEFVHGNSTMYCHTWSYHLLRALSIDKQLLKQCDYLFFPGGVQMMSFLNCKCKAISYTDNTFHIMRDYYWGQLSKWQENRGEFLEKIGIKKSGIIIKASHWAAESVNRDYDYGGKVHVLKFGANIDDNDFKPIDRYNGGTLNILFSGVDYARKGAEIAIKTVDELCSRGIKCKLLVVGLNTLPDKYSNNPNIELLGFLNKSNEKQYHDYLKILQRTHLFLLPTRAECAGIVFCEASAHGIPTITYDTGGIPDYVVNGVNGYRLPLTAGHMEFADKIQQIIETGELHKLYDSSISQYHTSLNWRIWSEGFADIIKSDLQSE